MKKFIFVAMACVMLMATGCGNANVQAEPEVATVEETPKELMDILPNPDDLFADATGEKTVVNQDGYFGWMISGATEDMLDIYIQALKDAGFTKKVIEVGGYGYQAFDETESFIANVVYSSYSNGDSDLIIQASDAEDYEQVISDMETEEA